MKRIFLSLLSIAFLFNAVEASAAPEQDRKHMIEAYKKRFPGKKLDDYIFGALMLSPDAKAQYDSVMEFPPFESVIDNGKKMWETPFKNGKTFASCFPNNGKNVAGNYPYYEDKLGKVVTFEMAINQCLKNNGEAEYKHSDIQKIGVLTAYARTLSDGMKMNIKVEGTRAVEAYETGKKFYYTRRGQLNFACASCHADNAGNTLRTELLSPTVGQATHWPVFRAGENLNTLHVRYRRCLEQVRAAPLELGSEDFNNLEYFHSYMSNGLKMKASVYRK